MAARGISPDELAERLDVPPGRVIQILSGEAELTMRSLAVLAEELNTSVEIRFFDPPPPPPAPAPAHVDHQTYAPASGNGVLAWHH